MVVVRELPSSLEWLPRLGVVHALVDDHVLGLPRAEVERDVGELVLLGQADGEAGVLARRQVLRLPARLVVRVVQVRQELGRVRVLRRALVAHAAHLRMRGGRRTSSSGSGPSGQHR